MLDLYVANALNLCDKLRDLCPKICAIVSVLAIDGNAFEFGYIGNTSFGMGRAGVGVANSAWGLYYNPTLQGVDAGLDYAMPKEYLVIGVVAKNLNSPTLNANHLVNTNGIPANDDKLKMDAQYCLGISTRAIPLTTLAMDFDLKPNYEFSGFNTKVDNTANSIGVIRRQVQYISFGAMLNAGILDLRLGAAKDIKEKNAKDGRLLSAGVGFGYFDFAFFSSAKMSKLSLKVPTEFSFKLGGSFSF